MSSSAAVSAMNSLTYKNQALVYLNECQGILEQMLAPTGPLALSQANATQAQESADAAAESQSSTQDLRNEVAAWHSAIQTYLTQAVNARNGAISASVDAAGAASSAAASAGAASDSAVAAAISAATAAAKSGSADWGKVYGNIADQSDLVSALAAKYPNSNPSGFVDATYVTGLGYITSSALSPYLLSSAAASTYFQIPTGNSTQYIAGDGTLVTFPSSGASNKLTATVYNQTGATLTKGAVVYINGAHGNLPTVAKAQANAESTSSGTYGFVSADISDNSSGTIVISGLAENLDTNSFVDGDKIYLSPTVAGGWTTTKPVAPNHMVYLGVVTRAHPTLGTIQLRLANGFELDEIHDCLISGKVNLDLLSYESSSGLWKNKSFSTLGLATLASPALTGTPTAPTAATATNTTQIATTAYVKNQSYATTSQLSSYATLASPTLTGDPKAPTPATADNDTSIATTAFVKNQSYVTSSSLTSTLGSYYTASVSDGRFYPISSNPSNFITSAALSGLLDQASADNLYVSKSGGTLNGSALLNLYDSSFDSELGGWGFGVELTADTTQNASVQYNAVAVQNSSGTMSMTPSGLTFPDSTTQGTAASPFGGGTVGSPITVTGSGGSVSLGDSIGLDLSGSTAGAGVKFSDGTIQYTAATASYDTQRAMADGIAMAVNYVPYYSNYIGFVFSGSIPCFMQSVPWSLVDSYGATYGFSYYSSGYAYFSSGWSTGPMYVRVNSTTSSIPLPY
jgi:hypothetical protein